jgi:tetratricopeptide (TPR) repeat protein
MRLLNEIRNLMGNYHVKSGMYHYYRAEYTQAIEFLQKALRDESELGETDRRSALHYLTLSFLDLAAKLESNGEIEECLRQLRQAAEVSPGFPDIRYRLGQVLELLERYDDAVHEYESAIGGNREYLDARVALGFCLLRLGKSERAADVFRQALKVRRRMIERPCRLGLEKLEQGDMEGAIEAFHQAFLSLPRLTNEYLQKALERLAAEDYEKALKELDRALEINPEYPDLHNIRGIVLCELERLDEAIDAFRLSASLSPEALVPRLNLAFAALRAERHEEAEAELELILESDPSEPTARAKLEELRAGLAPEKRRPLSRGNAR